MMFRRVSAADWYVRHFFALTSSVSSRIFASVPVAKSRKSCGALPVTHLSVSPLSAPTAVFVRMLSSITPFLILMKYPATPFVLLLRSFTVYPLSSSA